jgi:hypothetical protein
MYEAVHAVNCDFPNRRSILYSRITSPNLERLETHYLDRLFHLLADSAPLALLAR